MTEPAAPAHHHDHVPHGRERDRVLTMIALFKCLKALVLIAVGFGALRLIHSDLRDQANAMFDTLGGSVDVLPVLRLLRDIGALAPNSLRLFGAGAFLYAALFITEGIGLWRQKRWAEYLTVIATASFIPFEIYEITVKQTWPRIGALVINVLVVAYLIWRIRNPTPWQAEEIAEVKEKV
jgi:uncharacterized membrane protein (DUF2068 family)